jgi:outer membrane immunogenic protein
MLKYLAAGVAAMGIAAPAMAQSPSAAPAGFRIEAVAGIDHGSAYGQHATGFLYGLGAGYDFAVGTTASLGIDAEATDATTDASGAQAGLDL